MKEKKEKKFSLTTPLEPHLAISRQRLKGKRSAQQIFHTRREIRCRVCSKKKFQTGRVHRSLCDCRDCKAITFVLFCVSNKCCSLLLLAANERKSQNDFLSAMFMLLDHVRRKVVVCFGLVQSVIYWDASEERTIWGSPNIVLFICGSGGVRLF